MTITFSTTNGIPASGSIVIVMDSDWDPTLDTCEVEGLDNESDTNQVRCQRSGNTYTIDRFAAFTGNKSIIAKFTKVMPPTNTNTNANAVLPTSNLFNSIITYT
jgi:hypothetical protein